LTLDPDLAMAYRGLGNAYVGKGEPEAALQRFQELLTEDPDNGLAYYGMGNVHSKQGAEEAALGLLPKSSWGNARAR